MKRRFLTLDRREFWAPSYGDREIVGIPEPREPLLQFSLRELQAAEEITCTRRRFTRERYRFVCGDRTVADWVEYREGWNELHTAWSIEARNAGGLHNAVRAVKWKDEPFSEEERGGE